MLVLTYYCYCRLTSELTSLDGGDPLHVHTSMVAITVFFTLILTFKTTTMIILRTKSQLKDFTKRMKKIHTHYYSEDCGCCRQGTRVDFDTEKNRVIKVKYGEHQGFWFTKIEVLAIFKPKSRVKVETMTI